MFAESPLVEKPTAMSSSPAWAMSCREKTSSNPTSLESAVRTAWSSTKERAGSGAPVRGVAEQLRRPLGIGRAATVAEAEQPSAPGEALRHGDPGALHLFGATFERVGAEGGRLFASSLRADMTRSVTRAPASRSSASMKG